jgi:hypothetical protein
MDPAAAAAAAAALVLPELPAPDASAVFEARFAQMAAEIAAVKEESAAMRASLAAAEDATASANVKVQQLERRTGSSRLTACDFDPADPGGKFLGFLQKETMTASILFTDMKEAQGLAFAADPALRDSTAGATMANRLGVLAKRNELMFAATKAAYQLMHEGRGLVVAQLYYKDLEDNITNPLGKFAVPEGGDSSSSGVHQFYQVLVKAANTADVAAARLVANVPTLQLPARGAARQAVHRSSAGQGSSPSTRSAPYPSRPQQQHGSSGQQYGGSSQQYNASGQQYNGGQHSGGGQYSGGRGGGGGGQYSGGRGGGGRGRG